MEIEDLRAQQEAARASRAIGADLRKQLDAALVSVEASVKKRTALELSVGRWDLSYGFFGDLLSINGDKALIVFEIAHLNLHSKVALFSMSSSIKRLADSSWQMRVQEYRKLRSGEYESLVCFELRVVADRPWIAVRIGRGSSILGDLWWRGPEDNDKLATAIVDAIAGKKTRSEFTLARPKSPWRAGCVLLAACLTISMAILVALW